MRTLLILTVLLAAPSLAYGGEDSGHDIPFGPEDIQEVREMCGKLGEINPDSACNRLAGKSDEQLLEGLETIRQTCLGWIEVEPELEQLIQAYDPFLYGFRYSEISVVCAMPQTMRPYLYATLPSDPDALAAIAARARSRIKTTRKAEARRAELLEELGVAFESLQLQRAEGLVNPKLYHQLAEPLNECEEAVEAGPKRMLQGNPYDRWESYATACVRSSKAPVLQRMKEVETKDLTWLWIALGAGLLLFLSLFSVWSRRMALGAGQFAIQDWASRIEEMRSRVDRMMSEATSTMEQAQANELMAMVDALEAWVEHFGDDATPSDVERSAESALLARRSFRARGLPVTVPPATVNGTPASFWNILENRVER